MSAEETTSGDADALITAGLVQLLYRPRDRVVVAFSLRISNLESSDEAK